MSVGQDLMSAVAGGMASLAILPGLSLVTAPVQAQEERDEREIEAPTRNVFGRRKVAPPTPDGTSA